MSKMRPLMLRALSGEATSEIPLWLMRQAGRYLPEYRALRAKAGSFLNLCFNPAQAAEVTLQPLRRFPLDAAILFSDILVIPHALGQSLAFVEGEGPRLGALDIDALDTENFEQKLHPVYETLQLVRQELAPGKTLIGFAGAPWTVACYMVDGQGGGAFEKTRAMASQNPAAFDLLLDKVSAATATYLISQIRNGADTVQIFDSWSGLVPANDFDRLIAEPTRKIVSAVKAACPDVPVIGFPRGSGAKAAHYAAVTGIDAIGFDQSSVFSAAPNNLCIQGNLAPEVLLAGGDALAQETERVLQSAGNRPFVFNLGHGVIKETPVEHVEQLVRRVKEFRR